MAKKSRNSGNKSSSSSRSVIGTIIAAIILVVAVIAGGLTGVDVNDILDLLGQPTLDLPTTAPPTITTAPPSTLPPGVTPAPDDVRVIPVGQGFGAARDFWQVFFTAPTGSRDPATYVNGIDVPLAQAINAVQRTLDIAAFEFNNPVLTQAVLDAHQRGVQVRMVVDNEHGLHDDNTTIGQFVEAGIPVRDDGRSGLMHNKFMIMDSREVWTGSTNYTINGVYRNNNNMLALRSNRVVLSYQAEFNEMYEDGSFGPRSPRGNSVSFTERGVPIQTIFAPEDDSVEMILSWITEATTSVRFMAFSFTERDIAEALIELAEDGVSVSGIFERVGSEASWSELTRLFCAGLDARQDGNPFILHHKVFIIDNRVVLTGSFNFSQNATKVNDENMIILEDPSLAAQYTAEFERRWAESVVPSPDRLDCSTLEE